MRALSYSNPLFQQGKQMIKDNQCEKASEFFSELLSQFSTKYGDSAAECAFVWFEYGNSLLQQEELNPSDDLLGTAATEAKKAASMLVAEIGGANGDEDSEGSDSEDDEQPNTDSSNTDTATATTTAVKETDEGDDEEATDMEIAWEALEMCRTICKANEGDAELEHLLSETYFRLGDLQRFNGIFEEAVIEYGKCLECREVECEDHDRALSEVHYMLAVTHIYNSSEEGKDPLDEKKKALSHYRSARQVLQLSLEREKKNPTEEAASSSAAKPVEPPSSVTTAPVAAAKSLFEDTQDILDELTETIDALSVELKAAGRSVAGPVTTIGFGTSGSSSTSSSSSTALNNPFLVPSSTSSASSSTPVVSVFGSATSTSSSSQSSGIRIPVAAPMAMQVKKKVKLNPAV